MAALLLGVLAASCGDSSDTSSTNDAGGATGGGAGAPGAEQAGGAPGGGGAVLPGDAGQGGRAVTPSETSAGAGGAPGGARFSTRSLSFDGVDGYVSFGKTSDFFDTQSTSHSISLWVKHASDPESGEGIFGFNVTGTFGMGSYLFWSLEDPVPSIAFYAPSGKRLAASVPEPRSWHHVVAVMDGAAQRASLYLDGQLAREGTALDGSIEDGPVEAGRYNSDNVFALHGWLDELGIWSVALDAEAVKALYGVGHPTDLREDQGNYMTAKQLVAYYRLGEGDSETLLADSAGSLPGAGHGGLSLSTDVP